ncbi:magnesium transporter [Cellulomonas hominis]|uniref:magnesium transporter n=1 Tax=Cellulomonas hominis TaxID=156981 RepID=UPI00144480EC|nr:magnesium transporter [Cellulomonas hominis]NKY12526.1 magnesium transporter [Cellulomonas hominis]
MTRHTTTVLPPRRAGDGLPADLDLHDVVAVGTRAAVAAWLQHTPDARTRADELAELSDRQVRSLVGLLDPATAADLLGSLDPHAAAEVVQVVEPAVAAGLVDSLDADEAAELLRSLPDAGRAAVLAAMRVTRSAVVRGLLAWPEDSAAARMNPDVVSVRPGMSVREAVAAVREQTESAAQSGEVYVTTTPTDDAGPVLLGVVSFRDLVLAGSDRQVASLMREDVVTVEPTADQEAAARLLHRHRLTALPVVADGQLLGVLTPDDVADIVEEEATEDAVRQGGAQPLDVPYLRASPWLLWRKRIVWMLVLFIAEMYTGTVLRAFEEELDTVIALAFFVPLLIGTGGNAGTQITTTLIRAMAVGQVRLRDVGKVLRKELTTGALIAVTIATVGWLRAWNLGVGPEVALTVAVAAAAIVLWSSLVASVLPLVLRRIGIDPAVVSGPMITTLVDGTGLIIYFEVARLLISSLGA